MKNQNRTEATSEIRPIAKLYRVRGSTMLVIPREVGLRSGVVAPQYVRVWTEKPGEIRVELIAPSRT